MARPALPRRGHERADEAARGISSVTAFDVRIHLVYRSHEPNRTQDAESDWTGVARLIPDCDICTWEGAMAVRASAHGQSVSRGDHTDNYTFTAQGSDQQSMGLVFYEDRTYEFGFGYADVPGQQSMQCSAGKCTCDPKITAFYSYPLRIRLPIPQGATALSGTQDFTAADSPTDTFTVTWSFTPVGMAPKRQAVPHVAGSVQRGDPVVLDGSASTGRIQDYKWTFSGGQPAADGSTPNTQAELHGSKVQVTLLDGMQVTLTVSDGDRTDAKSVAVAVTPRGAFETKVSHVASEGRLTASAPMFGRTEWEGGENVCAFDPPASLDEPVHVLQPQSGGYTLTQVSDQGPYAGFTYVQAWQVEAKRQSLINKWIVEDAAPILTGLKSFYQANLDLRTDVVAYLAAARQHERMHTQLMEKSIRANDPARYAERAYGKDEARLRQDVDARVKAAEQAATNASKDPLPRIWSGKIAVPTPDTGQWKVITTDV